MPTKSIVAVKMETLAEIILMIKVVFHRQSRWKPFGNCAYDKSRLLLCREIMAELFGKATGCCRGQGGSMHLFSKEWNMLGGFAFIAEGIPVATGAAFQTKYRKEAMGDETADQVTIAFFGDGTCNNGSFFECLNMAGESRVPREPAFF